MAVSRADLDAITGDRTVPSMFVDTVRAHGERVAALRGKTADGWYELRWRDYADAACRVAAGLRGLGVGEGDRVVLLMRNRVEFHLADLGVLLAGATPISIYQTSSPDQIAHLASHAKARVAIVEDAAFLRRLDQARAALPTLATTVLIDGNAPRGVVAWDELVAHEPVDLADAAGRCRSDQLATVIYTSGTTGPPKGVQLTHRNVIWTAESYRALLGDDIRGLRVVSYLPMAHIAERMHSHYLAMASAFEVSSCPEPGEIAAYTREVRPQSIFGVPRVWEKMHALVQAGLDADAVRGARFADAVRAALPLQLARRERTLSKDEQRTLDALDATVLRQTREVLGLDDARSAVSGAAPLPVEIVEWFVAIGVPFSEIYGMSENTGPLTWDPWQIRPGTVGRPLPGVEVRLGGDGEILARGGNVFPGYLDDPAETAEALDAEGWLHTGDIGVVDDDGYLRIVDRKKELIITAGGKNVSPANLEAALRTLPLVGQACAIGDQRPFVGALLTLDPDAARAWATRHGRDGATLAALAADPELLAELGQGVERVMAAFSSAERVRTFVVLADEWLLDSDELTPTAKLKRRVIHAKYAAEIESLYA